jgi:hypothetical protein
MVTDSPGQVRRQVMTAPRKAIVIDPTDAGRPPFIRAVRFEGEFIRSLASVKLEMLPHRRDMQTAGHW